MSRRCQRAVSLGRPTPTAYVLPASLEPACGLARAQRGRTCIRRGGAISWWRFRGVPGRGCRADLRGSGVSPAPRRGRPRSHVGARPPARAVARASPACPHHARGARAGLCKRGIQGRHRGLGFTPLELSAQPERVFSTSSWGKWGKRSDLHPLPAGLAAPRAAVPNGARELPAAVDRLSSSSGGALGVPLSVRLCPVGASELIAGELPDDVNRAEVMGSHRFALPADRAGTRRRARATRP